MTQITEAGDTLRPLILAKERRPCFLSQLALRMWPALEPRVTASTLALYKINMRPLIRSNLGGVLLHDITARMVEDFTQSRLKEVGPSSVNGSLRVLRRALRLAEEWKLINRAPRFSLLPNEHSREFVISEELLEQMLAHDHCTPLLKNMLPFLIDTGLRVSEALALRWDTVGLEPMQGASLGWVYVEKGKSRFAKRHVPLTERALQILTQIKKNSTSPSRFVFPDAHGEPLTRHVPGQQFHTLRESLKLPSDCVLHSTRHTFCTRLGLANVDSFSLQRLAGHSSVVISARYVHPSPSVLEQAIGKLTPV